MFSLRGIAALLSLPLVANFVNAAKHKAFVGREGAPDVFYTVEFDDEALTLELAANTSVPTPGGFVAFNFDKTTLYSTVQDYGTNGAGSTNLSVPVLTSYSIDADGNLTPSGELYATSDNADTFGSGVWVAANFAPPYEVHMISLNKDNKSGHIVMSVDANGSLKETSQTFVFGNTSYLHGGTFHPTMKWVYILDVDQNMIFTYSTNNGSVEYVANFTLPYPVDGPRHAIVHPNGQKLYLVTENSNHLAAFNIDLETGLPTGEGMVYYSMLQEGEDASLFWCSEVMLSPSNSLLWAANRGRVDGRNGSISLFTLDDEGEVEKQNFLINTTTSGGLANLVAPVLFSDRYIALPDLEVGFVEMWELAEDNSTATIIAHLDLADGGCCENVIWWS